MSAIAFLGRVLVLLWFGLAGASAVTAADCPPPAEAPTTAQAEALARAAPDRGFLWRISKDGRSSYLYGTVHAARLGWVFPGPRVSRALAASDTVALELDPLDPAIQRGLQHGMAAARGDAALPAALAQRLQAQMVALCVEPAQLAGMAPELQLATLAVLVGRRDGIDPAYGIDIALAALARASERPVVSLETAEEQIGALRGQDHAATLEMVASGLDELESGRARPLLLRMASLWADGNHAELSRYAEWCECLRTDADRQTMKRLLDDRNPGLAEGIAALHAAGRTVFAAVGSLHMIGPAGVHNLLAQRGFRVERIGPGEPS